MALLLAAGTLVQLAQAEPKVRQPALQVVRDSKGVPIAVDAVGLPREALLKAAQQPGARETYSKLLALYVDQQSTDSDIPALAGNWSIVESSLRFTPKFPLLAGMKYRAELRPEILDGRSDVASSLIKRAPPVTLEINLPAEEVGVPSEVLHIYPSTASIPENNLRFYIHFSESMGRGEAYSHLQLLDRRGEPITDAFLEIGEELWDPRARRLTLLIDPGRIKKGVTPREELGPVLEAGGEYTLVVDQQWRDATGRPLKTEFRKKFRAVPPVETAVDPETWKLSLAKAGSVDPLVIRFPAPLDRALLERAISISGLNGPAIAGRVSISDDERCWEFRPLAAWSAGRFQLVVDTALEDLAGNRIGKPFEVDQFTEIDKTAESEPTRLPFEVR